MAHPEVRQAELLADALEQAVRELEPETIAIVGCAGGNGLDRLIPLSLKRVIALDINADYVQQTEQRFRSSLPQLATIVANAEELSGLFEPVELVYAALILEYVDVSRATQSLSSCCADGGYVLFVTQIESHHATVSNTPYASLSTLASAFSFVDFESLKELCLQNHLNLVQSKRLHSVGGKGFQATLFKKRCERTLDIPKGSL